MVTWKRGYRFGRTVSAQGMHNCFTTGPAAASVDGFPLRGPTKECRIPIFYSKPQILSKAIYHHAPPCTPRSSPEAIYRATKTSQMPGHRYYHHLDPEIESRGRLPPREPNQNGVKAPTERSECEGPKAGDRRERAKRDSQA